MRIKPAQKPEEGKDEQSGDAKGPQAASGPPQGARFDAPAPESGGQQGQGGQDSGAPGVTGIYRQPESQQTAGPQATPPAGPQPEGPQPPTGDEGVRVIRKD